MWVKKIKNLQFEIKWFLVNWKDIIGIFYKNSYITYRARPKKASDIYIVSEKEVIEKKSNIKFAIIIQGPLILKDNFTIETIKLYKKTFPDTFIILSTWEGEDKSILELLINIGIFIVQSKIPEFSGYQNINNQIISTKAGILYAKECKATFVLKTRTDQRMYATNINQYLINIILNFPIKDKSIQTERLVGVSLNTFKNRRYGISDMIMFGHIEDMFKYWNIDLDERRIEWVNINKVLIADQSLDKLELCEIYLATNYYKKLGNKLEWTIADSNKLLVNHFCIVDIESFDLYWPKYYRFKENKWINYENRNETQEITFKDWLNMYTQNKYKNEVEIENNYLN